jgi:predicted small secreted protein
MKKFMIMAFAAVVATASLAACQNTLHGAGQDIENAGESVQENVPPKR